MPSNGIITEKWACQDSTAFLLKRSIRQADAESILGDETMADLTPLQRFLLVAVTSMAIVTTAALAWGPAGHTRVGAIADQLLKDHPRAALQVRRILGTISLAQAGPWGDCVRSVSGPKGAFRYSNNARFPECDVFEGGARQLVMENYVRNNWSNFEGCKNEKGGCHSQYHFVNMELRRTRYELGDAGTHEFDIVHAMNAAIAVLRTPDCSGPNPPATTEINAPGDFHFTCGQALLMLAHFIGDLHQPLHVGSVYLDEQGRRVDPDSSQTERDRARQEVTFTRGGNQLRWPNPKPKSDPFNLHSVWDRIPSISLNKAVASARQVPPTTGPIAGWVVNWANESRARANEAFEGLTFGPKDKGTWPVRFDNQADYDNSRRQMQRQQVALAGARLAQLLTAIWPDE